MMRSTIVRCILLTLAGARGAASLITSFPARCRSIAGPDGNTVVLDAPKGLIVFDTGRPPSTRKDPRLCQGAARPIAAIVNTTGTSTIRPAITTFDRPIRRPRSMRSTRSKARSSASSTRAGRERQDAGRPQDAGGNARPAVARACRDRPPRHAPAEPGRAKSGRMSIAGRTLDVHLAKFAATEGDVWLYDPSTKTAIVGDLVVGIVPFMDTACAGRLEQGARRGREGPVQEPDPRSRRGEAAPTCDLANGLRQFRRTAAIRHGRRRMRRRLVAVTQRSSSTRLTATMPAARPNITWTRGCVPHPKSSRNIASR